MALFMAVTRGSAPIADKLAITGDALFRRRSYMPLLLVPLFVLTLWDERTATPLRWEFLCFVVSLAGLSLRGFVVGTAPLGASCSINISGTTSPSEPSGWITDDMPILDSPRICVICARVPGTSITPRRTK